LKTTQAQIEQDLRNLGLEEGDTVFVKVDLGSVGLIRDNKRRGFLDALLNVVGPTGNVVAPTYTKTYLFPQIGREKKRFSTEIRHINTGAFSKLVAKHKDALRSTHPTNSHACIGPDREELVGTQTPQTHSYLPVAKVVERNGKFLIVGCVDKSPGFVTTHLVQVDLGYASEHVFRGLAGAWYEEDGTWKLFLRRDFGGHNIGARKIYSYYLDRGVLGTGPVGNTTGVIIDGQVAYDIDTEVVSQNKKFLLCDDPGCFSCRVSWTYNLKDAPLYVATKTGRILSARARMLVEKLAGAKEA